MDGAEAGFESYEEAIAAHPPDPLADQPRGDVILYSSGTTGRPKGIERPLRRKRIDDPSAATDGDASLLLVWTSLGLPVPGAAVSLAPGFNGPSGAHELGGTVVVMEKFDAEEFLRLVEREGVTHTQSSRPCSSACMSSPRGPGTLRPLESQVRRPRRRALPVEVKEQMIEWLGPDRARYYIGHRGQRHDVHRRRRLARAPGSVGRPLLGTPHICDEEGAELPVGEAGLVYFEQEQAPFEYHGDPEKTRASRHPEHRHWITLGDIGYLDTARLPLSDRPQGLHDHLGRGQHLPGRDRSLSDHAPERDRRGGLRPARPRVGE